jgi:ferrous iron transport protein B
MELGVETLSAAANKTISVALAGNPNSGKTTLFNALTGARQHVGNYPGVTVEKKEGEFSFAGTRIAVVDLPGTYSLTANSPEEVVARNVVLDESPDVIVDVVDASNLERNLYLAVQFMELGQPMILAFNMSDIVEARGDRIDIKRLSNLFRVPIIRISALKGQGLPELKQSILAVAKEKETGLPGTVTYGGRIESTLRELTAVISENLSDAVKPSARWIALKLLENDDLVNAQVREQARNPEALSQAVEQARQKLEKSLGDDAEILIADRRYGFISGACQEAVRISVEARHTMSDRIDMVMTHRVLSIPIFLFLMFLVFKLTFAVGDPIMGWIEDFFGWAGNLLTSYWPEASAPLLQSLLVDGLIGGVGGVIVFLPNILLLFLAIAILEDSGYMARAAFIVDRFMHKIGLHGKSFIPMLIGFGCTVPAIMATRTLENRQDRLTTMLVAPLMSCGARLTIYALIIPAFFPPAWHARVLWLIYIIGIVLAIAGAKLLRSTLFKGEAAPFVMELPPYRLPTLRGILTHMWERGWLYLKKAGTLILAVTVVMWALTTFPQKETFDKDYAALSVAVEQTEPDSELAEAKLEDLAQEQQAEAMAYTFAGRVGHALEPVLRPLGFDWRIGTALIGAFVAKEVFVAQLGVVYAIGETDEESGELRDKLRENYNPLQAFCIMLFCLISAPCMATIAITRRESNSWKWALFQLASLTILAYVVTFVVYQVGTLLQIGV